MGILYIDIEQALKIHKKTIELSGGGTAGIIEKGDGKLESILEHIQNDDYYPTFEEKLIHLIFSVNKFHCFQDGNKRISIVLGEMFLLLNGYMFAAKKFINEMENISYHVAAGRIDKDLLYEIISAIINDEMDNEDLKFKIYKAIQD